MTKEELAAEAQRIKENDAAQAIVAGIRSVALEELSRADPTDADAIRKHQAIVMVADTFFSMIDAYVSNGQPKKPAGIV